MRAIQLRLTDYLYCIHSCRRLASLQGVASSDAYVITGDVMAETTGDKPFDRKMARLTATLEAQFDEARRLQTVIIHFLKDLRDAG